MDFFAAIESAWRAKGSLLCVGLDPRLEAGERPQALYDRSMRLVDATIAYAACYKPNSAFYEAYGEEGIAWLKKLIAAIPTETPVLLDAKRGDIGATAEAYAQACFGQLGAGGVTLNPYMGRDAVDPFLAYPEKAVFVLARTSNPGAPIFQDLIVGGKKLYEAVAAEASSWSERVGLVAAGNDMPGLAAVRAAAPKAWLLAPGIGAQGGDIAEAWKAGARADGLGILPVAARSVAGAADPKAAARALVDAMRRAYDEAAADGGVKTGAERGHSGAWAGFDINAALKRRIMRGLVDTGCFKTGSFTLKSGKISPFYVDLRRVIADMALLDDIASAYASVASGMSFDRIAGIPAAALPLATASAIKLRKPMIWPRMPAKDHGSGTRVEGDFKPGERVLLLDDLITTGASKQEAIAILRSEGLIVEDLAVLIERGRQGRADMEAQGVRLGAFFHVRELFALCFELGIISSGERRAMEAYADGE
ncbi:MAG TPA: orotate phosphoribosyltransferase [Spirochaetaceae bacterium]|nr:orotate phosphoribosyltransferase [Spirochaetaceae bacterium]